VIRTLVAGASGHARVIMDSIDLSTTHRVAGVLDPSKVGTAAGPHHTVVGPDEQLPQLMASLHADSVVVAIGDNWKRKTVAESLRSYAPHVRFACITHPSAQIARDVSIGQGAVVMAGAVINTGSCIGAFCIVNTGAIVDHDCVLEDYASIAPGVILSGNVTVGAFSAVGPGAVVLQGKRIGPQSVVGAGAVLTRDIAELVVAFGVPARVVRARSVGEPYMR
jgi:sugar O-acyltransferase (sialic acid O-acetyltransferase NeuD family)